MLKRLNSFSSNDLKESDPKFARESEQGSSTTKFVLVLIALLLVAYGGFNYVVLTYQCSHFKEKMQEIITQAYSLPNNKTLNDPEAIRQKIRSIGDYDGVPADAVINVIKKPSGTEAQVTFARDTNLLPFNMYKYKYQFDFTAKPPTMFEVK